MNKIIKRVLIILILLSPGLILKAQINWYSFGNGVNGTVWTIKSYDNNVYIGGSFTSVNGGMLSAKRIAKWDGTAFFKIGDGIENGIVRAIAFDGNNIYVGGTFTETGSGPCNRIAKWDGYSWQTLGSYPNDGVKGDVYAILVNNGNVYVAGSFTEAGNISANNIAKWDGTSWSSVGVGFNNDVYALTICNNEIYAGGAFTQSGDTQVKYIAKWNGTTWLPLGVGLSGTCWSLETVGNDIYAGGNFFYVGDLVVKNIAKWNGSSWSVLGDGLNGTVYGICQAGNFLYAVGRFKKNENSIADYLARWSGSSWIDLGNGINNIIYSVAKIKKSGEIAIGGNFSTAGGNPISYLAKFTDSQNPFQISPGWKWLNPITQGNDLNDVHLFDENTFIAVGNYGTILKSSNFGNDFKISHKSANFDGNLKAVHFPSVLTGYAVGNSVDNKGKVFKSTDGGNNWGLLNLPVPSSSVPLLNDVHFVSENTGWTCGNSPGSGITLYKTTTGGSSWEIQQNYLLSVDLVKIFFENEMNGVIAGKNGAYLETTDGGNNWIVKNMTGQQIDLTDYVQDASGNRYSVHKNGKLFKSTDKGNTWTQKYSGVESLLSIYFPDANNGFAVGKNGYTIYTTNSGENWNETTKETSFTINKAVGVSNKLKGVAVGERGELFVTTDGGKTWNEKSSGSFFKNYSVMGKVQFENEKVGYMANLKGFYKTTDGGKTWIISGPAGVNNFLDTKFYYDYSTGQSIGILINDKDIYKTTNSGETWTKVGSTTGNFSGITKFSSNEIIVYGENGEIKLSTNNGTSWNNTTVPSQSFNVSSVCKSSQNYFATGSTGSGSVIYMTTNLGSMWSPVKALNKNLYSMSGVNETTVIAVGENGTVVKTTDGGINWTESNLGFSDLKYVYKAPYPSESVFLIGDKGTIFRSDDQGKSWIKQESNTNVNLTGCDFKYSPSKNYNFLPADFLIGWIVGENGVMLTTEDGGGQGIVKVEDENPQGNNFIPDIISLYQNYPNPFNPSTSIKFNLSKESKVKIIIYDILGSVVKELVNEVKPAGSHIVYWNSDDNEGRKVASGVYFYRLEAGDVIQIKKMNLVK